MRNDTEAERSVPSAIDALFFADLPAPATFYIARHGESVANAERRIQGLSDFPLNEAGRSQARGLAGWLRGKAIRRVYASPLVRAAETARIVCGDAGLPAPVAEPLLAEIDVGAFSGLTLDEAKQRYPEDFERFECLSWEGVPSAERADAIALRARKVWTLLKAAAAESGGDVLALTHGGLIQWLVRVTFGCPSWMPLLTTGNCGVFELSVKPTKPGMPAFLHWREINAIPGGDGPRVPPVF